MSYLSKGLSRTLKSISHHPFLGILLLILQLTLFFSFGYTYLTYQAKIFENAQGIIEPLQNANYDSISIEAGMPFSSDLISVYSNYLALVKNAVLLFLWILILFLFLEGAIWLLTHYVLEQGNKKVSFIERIKIILHQWGKYLVCTLILIGPFSALGYYFLKIMMSLELSAEVLTLITRIMIGLFLVSFYFLLVGFVFITAVSWKEFFSNFFTVSIRKIYLTLPILLINLILLSLSVYSIYYTLSYENYFNLMILASIAFLILMVLARMFWIACLEEIAHEKNHH